MAATLPPLRFAPFIAKLEQASADLMDWQDQLAFAQKRRPPGRFA